MIPDRYAWWRHDFMAAGSLRRLARPRGQGCAGLYWVCRSRACRRGNSGGFEQGHQTARAIERGEVVVPADMRVADEHLRHRATTAPRHHLLAAGRVFVDQYFFNLLDAAGL